MRVCVRAEFYCWVSGTYYYPLDKPLPHVQAERQGNRLGVHMHIVLGKS